MRHPTFTKALLALTILLGQWLSVAHALEHPALEPDSACQICLYGQGVDSGAVAPAMPAVHASGPVDAPHAEPVQALPTSCCRPYSARGPPRFSV